MVFVKAVTLIIDCGIVLDVPVCPILSLLCPDEDASTTITLHEWDVFLYRFGPIETCFDKVKGTVTARLEVSLSPRMPIFVLY